MMTPTRPIRHQTCGNSATGSQTIRHLRSTGSRQRGQTLIPSSICARCFTASSPDRGGVDPSGPDTKERAVRACRHGEDFLCRSEFRHVRTSWHRSNKGLRDDLASRPVRRRSPGHRRACRDFGVFRARPATTVKKRSRTSARRRVRMRKNADLLAHDASEVKARIVLATIAPSSAVSPTAAPIPTPSAPTFPPDYNVAYLYLSRFPFRWVPTVCFDCDRSPPPKLGLHRAKSPKSHIPNCEPY